MTHTQVFELGLFFSLPTYTIERGLFHVLSAGPVIFIAGRSVNVHLMLAFWVWGGAGEEYFCWYLMEGELKRLSIVTHSLD